MALVQPMQLPGGAETRTVGCPVLLDGAPVAVDTHPPSLDQHGADLRARHPGGEPSGPPGLKEDQR